MDLWQIVVLAVVQGITEFLPISSSGHLVIVAELMSPVAGKAGELSDLNVVLHVGTLLSIIVFYQRRVLRLLTEDRRTILLLIAGTMPAVLVGLPIELWFESILENALLAGVMLCATGLVLLSLKLLEPGQQHCEEMGLLKAIVIGVSQAAAILPGLSRSGSTIAAAMWLGVAPRSAATFSFLLAIPAIAGGGVLEAYSLMAGQSSRTPLPYLAIGMLVSFLVGLLALWWLVRWIERGRLQLFAWWCLPVGAGIILWQLL